MKFVTYTYRGMFHHELVQWSLGGYNGLECLQENPLSKSGRITLRWKFWNSMGIWHLGLSRWWRCWVVILSCDSVSTRRHIPRRRISTVWRNKVTIVFNGRHFIRCVENLVLLPETNRTQLGKCVHECIHFFIKYVTLHVSAFNSHLRVIQVDIIPS